MNNDLQDMQVQAENTANRLDTALHTLEEYQRVVAGAVKDGVYANDNYWWRELKRLANEQAVEHRVQADGAYTCPDCGVRVTIIHFDGCPNA